MAVFTLLQANAVTTGPQQAVPVLDPNSPAATVNQAIQAILKGTGTCTATVAVVASNDDNVLNGTGIWIPITTNATLSSMTGTAPVTGAFTTSQSWKYWGAYLTAITGTGADVTVLLSA